MLWIELDIPQLSSDGIRIDYGCFSYTYSLQSSSIHSPISSSFDATALSTHLMIICKHVQMTEDLTDLIIPNDHFNGVDVTSFNISGNMNLKRIAIGNNTFANVRVFELNGLSELERVEIGECCIKLNEDERDDGACRIVNCPNLISLRIGDASFCDYHSFELSNIPSLQSIDIGSNCFFNAPSFSLTGLID